MPTIEKPKIIDVSQKQTASDEEIFDTAKINHRRLDRLTLSKIVEAIRVFGEAMSSTKLYPYEKNLFDRIAWSVITNDGETITGEFSRQSGKSTTLAVEVPSLAILLPLLAEHLLAQKIKSHITKFANGFWTGIYGPDYERAGIIGGKINRVIGSKQAMEILSDPEIGMTFPKKISSYTDHLPRGSVIVVKSASKKVSIEGDTYHMVVTDETQEMDDYVLKKSISPMLSSTNGTTVHLGSAYPRRVYFYDVIQHNKKNDTEKPMRKRNHHEVSYLVAQKYNSYYKKYVAKEKEKLGEYSDEFRMSYMLYWPLERGMFITEDTLISLCAKPCHVSNFDHTNDHVIGIDIAKSNDSTVVTVMKVDWENSVVVDEDSGMTRYYKHVTNWLEISGVDYDAQFHMICDFLDNYKWSRLVCDATGVGSPMFDRLEKKYRGRDNKILIPFVFTRPDKSMGYTLLLKEILAGRLTFPNGEKTKALRKQRKFVEQMTKLSRTIEGGYLVVEHESSSGFDDFPDSLMLTVYGTDGDITEEVEEVIENLYAVPKGVQGKSIDRNFWNDRRR